MGRHAEAAFRSLGEDERAVARRILLRLVAGGGEGEALTRRRVARSELDADDDERVSRVLAALIERRLLVANNGTVELVHEALLEHWPRLRGWLAEEAHGRVLHRHVTHAAGEWNRAGRDRKRALPRSPPRRGAGVGGRGGAGAEPPGERVPGREPQGFRARGGAATPGEPAAPVRARPCSHAPGSLDRGRCCRAGTTEPGAETGSRRGRTTPRSAGADPTQTSSARCCSHARA